MKKLPTPRPPLRKRGRPKKAKTSLEAAAQQLGADIRERKRRVSAQDRHFIYELIRTDFTDPVGAAARAGFKRTDRCWQAMDRLKEVIDAERIRLTMGRHMELDEALRLLGEGARDVRDRKVQATFLTLVLRYHGVLSEKPMQTRERKEMVRQVGLLVEKLQRQIKSKPGAEKKIRTMLALGVEATDASSGEIERIAVAAQVQPRQEDGARSADGGAATPAASGLLPSPLDVPGRA